MSKLFFSIMFVLASFGIAVSVYGGHDSVGEVNDPNCICGPIDGCNGIPITSTTYCEPGSGSFCVCIVLRGPGGCVQGISASCFTSNP